MDKRTNTVAIVLLLLLGLIGAAFLLGLAKKGYADEWKHLGIALFLCSAVTGIGGALYVFKEGLSKAFWLASFYQAIGSLFLVALILGGGASMWTIMFWLIAAIGWVPVFVWMFWFFLMSIDYFRPSDLD